MLRNRLITAAVLIPLVVAGILLLPSPAFALVIGLLVLIGAREMGKLGGLNGVLWQAVYVLLVAFGMWSMQELFDPRTGQPVLLLVSLIWVMLTAWLVLRRAPLYLIGGLRPLVLLGGGILLTVAWFAVAALHQRDSTGPALVLFLFILIWVADSGAYFAGRAWGQRKLSPVVSPGKTWAGAAGALTGAIGCALALHYLALVDVAMPALVLLCLLVTAVSIGGDLFESLLKRQAGVKDSGTLLPGHGGALDRIDSLIAAAPVFTVGLGMLELLT